MLETQTRIAIAASLLWMAVATMVILGTHGPVGAHAESALDLEVPAETPSAEWMTMPVGGGDVRITRDAVLRC